MGNQTRYLAKDLPKSVKADVLTRGLNTLSIRTLFCKYKKIYTSQH